MRKEKDIIGERDIPIGALYGIHSDRARNNFLDQTPFQKEWYSAIGLVKLACYQTILDYIAAVREKYDESYLPDSLKDTRIFEVMCEAAFDVSAGKYFDDFIVPAIQGGAGTSINMNVNEIIANATLLKLGLRQGDYMKVDPLRHSNAFQSTNDVIPTALKIAVMQLLTRLERAINGLRSSVELSENAGRDILRMAYTQMQEAVPSSFGMLFSAYNEALSRDWWRISKCFERIKVVNLGGGATGTGMAIPRFFILEVLHHLQKLCGYPVTRSENLSDATQNLDSFVEVHAMLKAHAVNLEKIASDLRLLSSDIGGRRGLEIPALQAGSSIIPGKVNPVMLEYVIGISHKVYSNDMLISNLCGQGSLDLNPYLPIIGHALIESIKLLDGAVNGLHHFVFAGLLLQPEISVDQAFRSPAIATALVPSVGYTKATEIAVLMKSKGLSVIEANAKLGFLSEDRLHTLLKPENLLQLGYTLKTDA
jgi:aspartate ammonia-lyase